MKEKKKSNNRTFDVLILGLFPPPVTGAAKNTQLFFDELSVNGLRVAALNTSFGGMALTRGLKYHFKRVLHFIYSCSKLLGLSSASSGGYLYVVPDGGRGLWYTLVYILLVNRRFERVFVHHRTFEYIDNERLAMRLLVKILKNNATHIFLSVGMSKKFDQAYGDYKSLVITNARYIDIRSPEKATDEIVIGHLSNLCESKGIYDVLDTFEELQKRKLPVRLLLAGPVVEAGVQSRINQFIEQYADQVEYYGAVSGAVKDKFYDRLHVFLFPTRWPQEAQPNVIYESLAAGASVVSTTRGCISEMLSGVLGECVECLNSYPVLAADYVQGIWQRIETNQSRVDEIHELLKIEVDQSKLAHEGLVKKFLKVGIIK